MVSSVRFLILFAVISEMYHYALQSIEYRRRLQRPEKQNSKTPRENLFFYTYYYYHYYITCFYNVYSYIIETRDTS